MDLRYDLRLALDRTAFARHVGQNLRRRRPFEPDDWQKRLLRSESKRILMNCSRQSGKSTTAAIGRALHKAVYTPDSLTLMLGPAERQAKELFAKLARGYQALGGAINAESVRRLGLELSNGSRVEALPGTEKTVRSFSDVDLLIIDEAARVDDDLYYAVMPMLAVSGGTLMMLSTPYGKRGVFFREWTEGEGWDRYEVPATECPRITPEFLAEEQKRLPHRVYLQEYFCEFLETEDQLFSYEVIERAMSDDVEPLFGSDSDPGEEEVEPLFSPSLGGSL